MAGKGSDPERHGPKTSSQKEHPALIDLPVRKETTVEKELVSYVARALVDEPDEVEVNIIEGEKSTILELRVSPDDIGKVIGKHGRIAKALRTILSASATRTGKRVVLEILD
jgi:uncharacterized protein